MNAILSKEEIAELLEILESGGKFPRPEAVESRDFNRPLICSRQTLEKLQGVMNQVAKSLGEGLQALLRLSLQVELTSIEQERFQNISKSIVDPCCVFQIKMGNAAEKILLSLDVGVLLAAVDKLLGGSGKQVFAARELGKTELPIVDRIAEEAIRAIAKGMGEFIAFTPTVEKQFQQASTLNFINPDQGVLALRFGIAGDIQAGEIFLVIPFANLASLLGKATAGQEPQKETGKGKLQINPALNSVLYSADIEVSFCLGTGQIQLGELLTLEPGDVIPLKTRIHEPGVFSIAGRKMFYANSGVKAEQKAVEIKTLIGPNKPGGNNERRTKTNA